LSRADAEALISGDFTPLLISGEALAEQLYFIMTHNIYRPRCIVQYSRLAFLGPINNTRITFDKNIQTSALSLGMVGALSIIRYRTAIKDPRDSAYIFWCIAVGICCGVQEYLIAAIGSGFVFIFMMIFGAVKSNNRLLLIVRGGGNTEETVKGTVEKVFGKKARLCVVNAAEDSTEFIYELSRRDVETAEKKEENHITSIMMKLEGVKTVSLVDQNDEINQ
jgi:hypothetical protein